MNKDNLLETGGKQAKVTVYKFDEIDFKKVKLSELKESGAQEMAFINYYEKDKPTKLFVQSEPIDLVAYGVPRDGLAWVKNDKDREYMNIPLNDQPGSISLRNHLQQGDELYGSEATKRHLFASRWKRYEYVPFIKPGKKEESSDEEEEDEEKEVKKEVKEARKDSGRGKGKISNYDFCKMKFNFVEDQKSERVNKTKLIRVEGNKKIHVNALTISDVSKEIRFKSNVEVIFYHSKVWVSISKIGGNKRRIYGVTLKIMAVKYRPSFSFNVNSDDIVFRSNPNSNENSEEEPDKALIKAPQEFSAKTKYKKDDSDDIVAAKTTKPKVDNEENFEKKPTTKKSNDDDSSSEKIILIKKDVKPKDVVEKPVKEIKKTTETSSEKTPVKRETKKKPKQSASSEEDVPVKKTVKRDTVSSDKKSTKKPVPKKKKVSSDEDESS